MTREFKWFATGSLSPERVLKKLLSQDGVKAPPYGIALEWKYAGLLWQVAHPTTTLRRSSRQAGLIAQSVQPLQVHGHCVRPGPARQAASVAFNASRIQM